VQAPGSTGSSTTAIFYYRIAADGEPRRTRLVQRQAQVPGSPYRCSRSFYCALVLVLGT
jgi:hypothetical protein